MKEETLATNVFELQNGIYRRIIARIYTILIIMIVALLISVVDSIYVRSKLIEEFTQCQNIQQKR